MRLAPYLLCLCHSMASGLFVYASTGLIGVALAVQLSLQIGVIIADEAIRKP